jgi:ribonuclease HI
MKSERKAAPKPGTAKYYGVQAGHVPGVYADYASVLEQVTGFKGGKQKSFATWEEAQAYVNEGRWTPSDTSAPISLKGHLESVPVSVATSRKSSKKLKKNDGSAIFPETNGDYEPGTGPLPPGAEDGFDDRIKLPGDRNDGLLEFKTHAEQTARKMQPTGDFEGVLNIWTDGAAKGNGQTGAAAGIGIWFGHDDPR